MRKITKLFSTKAQTIDTKAMTAKFKISDGNADRMGEIVDQKSWNFANYKENPIVLWGHDPSQPENVLGTALNVEVDDKDNSTYATIKFDEDINPKAKMVFEQVARGTLRTVSVGMIVHTEDTEKDVTTLRDCELLEISIVPIPANPRAVTLSYRELGLSTKDAEYMIKSMQAEAELLQKELTNDKDGTTMDELMKAMQDMAAAMASQAEVLATIAEGVAKLIADEDAESADDEDAADGGADDATENPDGTPKKAAIIKVTKDATTDDTAKDGSNDASSADDTDAADEVDENTELTPEQEKEFEDELTKALTAENVTVK